MAKQNKVKTIYDRNGVKIQSDKYNWILILNGKDNDPSYFGDIRNLFGYLIDAKLRAEVKNEFRDIKQICDFLLQEIENIVDTIKNREK